MSEFEKAELRIKYTRLISYILVAITIVFTGLRMVNRADQMYYDLKATIMNQEYRIQSLENKLK
jgi:hypothetical protein